MCKQLFVVIIVIYLLVISPQANEDIDVKSDETDSLPRHNTGTDSSKPKSRQRFHETENKNSNDNINSRQSSEVYSNPVVIKQTAHAEDSTTEKSPRDTPSEGLKDDVPPFTIQDQLKTHDLKSATNAKDIDDQLSVSVNIVVSDAVTLNESSDAGSSNSQRENTEENSDEVSLPSGDNFKVVELLPKEDQVENQNTGAGIKVDSKLDVAEQQDIVRPHPKNESIPTIANETETQNDKIEVDSVEIPIKEESAEKIDEEREDATTASEGDDATTTPSIQPSEEEKAPTDEPAVEETETSEDKAEEQTADKASDANEKPDEKQVKLEVDDIQSFEEWKKNQIQSQEEAAGTETNGPPHRTIRTKKTQMNYASQDCGAKVLSHNPEAKHVGAILDENKDLYMLNPCSGQIWFVVELCEPIQVQQVQLTNLELFSSMPHLFDISISERFPAREWRLLGTFEARNERSIQTFVPKRDEVMFAKYIKFQMKSHFGNEHFCPLTLVRVLGVSMVEEYDESVEEKVAKGQVGHEPGDKDPAADPATTEDGNPAAPTDPPAAAPGENEGGSIGKMFNIVKNAVDNLLGNGNAASNNETSTTDSDHNVTQDETIDPDWESPITLVTNRSEVEPSPDMSTKQPLVTLIETGDGQEIVVPPHLSPPLYSLKFLSNFSPENFGTKFCWFLELMYRVSILSCVVQPHGNYTSASGAFPLVIDRTSSKSNFSERRDKPPEKVADETVDPNFILVNKQPQKEEEKPDPVPKVDPSRQPHDIPNSTKPRKPESKIEDEVKTNHGKSDTETSFEESDANTSEQQSDLNAAQVIANDVNSIKEVFVSGSKPGERMCDSPPTVHSESANKDKNEDVKEEKLASPTPAQPNNTDDTRIVDEETAGENGNTSSETNTGTPAGEAQIIQATDEQNDDRVKDDAPLENSSTAQSPSPPTEESDAKSIDAFSRTSNESSPPSAATTAIPSVDQQNSNKAGSLEADKEQVVINPGTNQKESVLMRLSNRIRTLEQNLSLSSAYLENLSQRYKRQMDEMQRAFNKTQTRLSETARVAEENNLKQSEAIAAEKEKTETLRKKLQDMTESLEHLNHCMIARHLCLMAIESVVFIVICVACFGIRQIRLTRRLEQTEKQIEFLLLHQTDRSNGVGNGRCGERNQNCNGLAKQANGNLGNKTSRKNLSGYDKGKVSLGKPKALPGNVSPSAAQRRRSLKTSPSPLFKRKTNQQGKIQKSSSKLNPGISSAITLSETWPPTLGKGQKSSKLKKHQSKSDNRLEVPAKRRDPAHPYYANDKIVSAAGCGSTALSWQKQFFTGISGKAR